MFHVYILISEVDKSFYVGQTNDLVARLKRHNTGLEKYTRRKAPWKVFWSVQVSSRAEAMALERELKNLKSRKRMMEFIQKNAQ